MTKVEMIERYGIERYNEHMLHMKERYRNDSVYRDHKKAHMREYANELYKNSSEHREYVEEYKMKDLNSNGIPKSDIRVQSDHILFRQRKHAKLKGYEIHHCFGYDDPSKFIYIPKTLHSAIHKFLREHSIDASSNHYKYITELLNNCAEYTYISA